MEEIYVGVLGCGRSAVLDHLPALGCLRDKFRVAAVCDLEKSRRDRVECDFPDVRHYRRAEDMLDDSDLDLVYIATPSQLHEQLALDCLGRGFWTVCEMPAALSHDGAQVLRGASVKSGRKLIAAVPALFSSEFRAAAIARSRRRLGDVYDIRIRSGTFFRRDDWQALKRCGGGASFYAAQEPLMQALSLLKAPPMQMWSDLKQLVSVGDAEDYVRIMLKTSDGVTADVEASSAAVCPDGPSITLRGTRGSFLASAEMQGGIYRTIDPLQRLPRKRSSVATPPLKAAKEEVRVVEERLTVPDPMPPHEAFWRAVYATVREGKPFPVDFDQVVETARYIGIARKSSPFAN